MNESKDAAKRRRRRYWIVACSLPGYVALVALGLMAWGESSHVDPSEPLMFVIEPLLLVGVASWGLAPFFVLFALVILLRDPWRGERPRSERVGLTLLVFGSPVAWFLSNLIQDAYHMLR